MSARLTESSPPLTSSISEVTSTAFHACAFSGPDAMYSGERLGALANVILPSRQES